MRRSAVLAVVIAAASLVAVAVAASKSPAVSLRTTTLGRVLVAANGHTLYMFTADKTHASTCYGQCASFWPPLVVSAKPVAGAGLNASLLATTKRKDGKLQVTYSGHPLYFFSLDAKAGQVKGEGFNHFGGRWWVLSAKGVAIMTTPVVQPPATTTTGGGGGYGP